jgi:integrase
MNVPVSGNISKDGATPAPFEQMGERIPDHLLYATGPNRAAGPALTDAKTELQVVEAWLAEYGDSTATFLSYRREVERFLNWIFLVHGIPLSSVGHEHVMAYQLFLEAPSPSEMWCAPRYTRRTDPAWRPFENGLTKESRGHAIAVLSSLFGYLRDTGYLISNPVAARRRTRSKAKSQEEQEGRPTMVAQRPLRYFPAPLMSLALETLTSLADALPHSPRKRELERGLFVIRFTVNTGLRRSELASARLDEFDTVKNSEGNQLQILRVRGKGTRDRDVVLTPAALEALRRYHSLYGMDSSETNAVPILLTLSGRNAQSLTELDDSQVYRIILESFQWVADALEGNERVSRLELQRLRSATPDWLRRTYATLCLEKGVAVKHVQTQLGHRSGSITLGYQASEMWSRYTGLVSAQI